MTTYRLNIENTGLTSDEAVQRMADLMQADGHDVEFTAAFGAVQRDDADCPVSESEWMEYLVRADQDA